MKSISLDAIRIDGGTQGRAVIDQPTVQNYLEAMKEGAMFPPMMTVFDGTTHWLVDGFHRYHALKLLGIKKIDVDYKAGTLEEAQVMSFGVNGTHGKPRTNEDKRKIVLAAIEHPLLKDKADNEIAKICAVSRSFVGAMRDPKVKQKQKENDERRHLKKANEINGGDSNSCSATTSSADPYAGSTPEEDEIKASEIAVAVRMEELEKIMESDDQLAAAHETIQRLTMINGQLEVRIAGLMNEKNECIAHCKKLQKEVDKLKKGK